MDLAILQLSAAFDEKLGGFDSAPKFPPHAALRLLLDSYLRDGTEHCLDMATSTLDHLQQGGIHDQLAGGFARYSTDDAWHVPHFEKMLYDNAQLAEAFLHAYQITKNESYRTTLEGILQWVKSDLMAPEGGFYTGMDADSEGVEGRYYAFTWDEVHSALPEVEAQAFSLCFDIRPEGNWEGTNVLWTPRPLAKVAGELEIDELTLAERLSRAKYTLLQTRRMRAPPLTDDKVLAGQTGLMLGVFAEAGRVLSRPKYVEVAERAAQFAFSRMSDETGQLSRAYRQGKAGQPAMLDDYAYLADGVLKLYETTGRAHHLLSAQMLVEKLISDFFDETTHRLCHSPMQHERLLLRIAEAHDGPTPNSTAVAVAAMTRLSFLLERPDWRNKGEAILHAHGQAAQKHPRGHCDLLRVAREAAQPQLVIVMIPGTNDAANDAMKRAIVEQRRPGQVLAFLPENPGPSELHLPLFRNRVETHPLPQIYVCSDSFCSTPVQTTTDLERTLLTMARGASIAQ